jgi:hypothetical protein
LVRHSGNAEIVYGLRPAKGSLLPAIWKEPP